MTLAGNGTDGTANGTGSQAQFSLLRGVAVDDTGTCYVTDGSTSDGLNKIRRIAPDGEVSTVYSEARGSTDFSSITLDVAGDVYFITTSVNLPWVDYTISKPSVTGSRAAILRTVARSGLGTSLPSVSAGHTLNLYYVTWSHSVWSYIAEEVNRLDATGSTNLYRTNWRFLGDNWKGFRLHGLLVDRSGNTYFGFDTNLNKLTPAGESRTVYSSSGLLDALGADVSGNVYAFENHRLIQLVTTEGGFGLAAFTRGGGTVSVDPPGQVYLSNAIVRVTAAVQPGWTFMGWTNDINSTETDLTLTMTNHISLQALFGMPLETKATNGTVLRSPDHELYPNGSLVQLTARPDFGFEFIRWSDGDTNPVRTVEITNLITLSALFSALPKFTLTAAALGGVGGTVSRNPDQVDYFRDTPVVVTAHPSNGYVFQVWLDNVLENPRTVIISSNTTLFAVFAQGQGTPPQITTTPRSTNVFVGGQANFTVAAQGSSPLTYQWRFKGTNVPGEVAPTLIISQVQTNQAGTYSVVVSNSVGTAIAEAVLSVITPFRFESFSIQSDSQVRLVLSGEIGIRYQIERSEDLAGWQEMVVLTNTGGVVQFTDPFVPTFKQRFYRALLLPSQ
jgi:hypothetical protein